MVKLNKRDKKLLKILDLDARQSNIQIAKKIKISKNVVNYNIKRLEDEKLIKGYNTIVDASKLGYYFFHVYIDFYERDINIDDELIDYLIKIKESTLVARLVGNWDVLAGFHVKDIHSFREVWFKVLGKFRKHIKDYHVSLVTEEILFRRAYLIDEKKDLMEKYWTLGKSSPEVINDLDWEILNMLVYNARTPITDIALKTKMSSMAIIYRIKQLVKKNIIVGYRASVDFTKLGYEYYRVNMHLDDIKAISKLIGFCHANPNIVKVMKSISDFDFEFDMEISNFDQFQNIIDEMKTQFPGTIRNYTYFKLLKYYKRVYLPS
jgi:Lrp/AsnC family transcriptional regulator, leucine-responsive regulatory protein